MQLIVSQVDHSHQEHADMTMETLDESRTQEILTQWRIMSLGQNLPGGQKHASGYEVR
jgi:hypothetical protein